MSSSAHAVPSPAQPVGSSVGIIRQGNLIAMSAVTIALHTMREFVEI